MSPKMYHQTHKTHKVAEKNTSSTMAQENGRPIDVSSSQTIAAIHGDEVVKSVTCSCPQSPVQQSNPQNEPQGRQDIGSANEDTAIGQNDSTVNKGRSAHCSTGMILCKGMEQVANQCHNMDGNNAPDHN
ncbi:hypothetical protein PAXINDRAFT_159002, partial [Paxillus involutus ATCC 200175]